MLKRTGDTVVASGAYALLTLVLTWPLVRGIARDVPADLGDPRLNVSILSWDADHMVRAIGGNVGALREYWHANIFHPHPLALAYSEHLTPQALMVLPVWASVRSQSPRRDLRRARDRVHCSRILGCAHPPQREPRLQAKWTDSATESLVGAGHPTRLSPDRGTAALERRDRVSFWRGGVRDPVHDLFHLALETPRQQVQRRHAGPVWPLG
jgi:hypothetical protein